MKPPVNEDVGVFTTDIVATAGGIGSRLASLVAEQISERVRRSHCEI